jgi:excisionase family DNA binding protein
VQKLMRVAEAANILAVSRSEIYKLVSERRLPCIRIGNRACFDINVNELRIPRTNNQAEDIRSITAAIQRQFEGWIRENPDQFMWSNRRWS